MNTATARSSVDIATLIEAEDVERRRVSRELHDDLGQRFARFQMDIESIAQQLPSGLSDTKRCLTAVGEQAAVLSEDLRRLAHRLHPAILDVLGLSIALENHVREFSSATGIPVCLSIRNVPKRLSHDIAGCVYRIVQEALRNVDKYAGDAAVEINVVGSPLNLTLSIRDTGVGFDLNSVSAKCGLGLISMQERASLVRGTFSVETEPGRGVSIRVQIPRKVLHIPRQSNRRTVKCIEDSKCQMQPFLAVSSAVPTSRFLL